MKAALQRLATYKLFPKFRKVFVTQLANNGFCYQPDDDAVSCEFCGSVFCNWATGFQGACKAHADGCTMLRGDTAIHPAETLVSSGNISVISQTAEVQCFEKPKSVNTNILNAEIGKVSKSSAPSVAINAFENGGPMFPCSFSEKGKTSTFSSLRLPLGDLCWMVCVHGILFQTLIVCPATPVSFNSAMSGVLQRLHSFAGHLLDNVAIANLPSRIAAEGFFFDPQTHVTSCYNCDMLFNPDPAQRRAAHPPPGQHCDQRSFQPQQQQYFVVRQQPLHQLRLRLRPRDNYGGVPNSAQAMIELQSLLQMGVTPRSQNPGYLSLDMRRDSFRLHPSSGVDYGDLARAGFFAVDRSHVNCFNCGLAMDLTNFARAGDMTQGITDMLTLHVQLHPACSFARHELQAEETRRGRPHQHPEASGRAAPGEASIPGTVSGEQTTPGSQPTRGICRFCPNTANALFLPCGHLVVCHRCAPGHTRDGRCPECGQNIQRTERVFHE